MSKERSPRAVCSTTIGTSGIGPPFRGLDCAPDLIQARCSALRSGANLQLELRRAKLFRVVVTIHIAELGRGAAARVLLRPPRPGAVPGLTYAVTTTTAPLGEPLLPPRQLGRAGMLAAWESDAAIDAFERDHPVAARFAGGYSVRLQPLRAFGSWAGMPGLPRQALPVAEAEPVGVLTLGRLRLLGTGRFRRSAGPAEA